MPDGISGVYRISVTFSFFFFSFFRDFPQQPDIRNVVHLEVRIFSVFFSGNLLFQFQGV